MRAELYRTQLSRPGAQGLGEHGECAMQIALDAAVAPRRACGEVPFLGPHTLSAPRARSLEPLWSASKTFDACARHARTWLGGRGRPAPQAGLVAREHTSLLGDSEAA